MGLVSKSYMRKDFLIYEYYEEMRDYLTKYEEAVSHIWICNRSLLNFLIYEENLIFFFISEAECFHDDIFVFILNCIDMQLYRSKVILIYANQWQFKILNKHIFIRCFNYMVKSVLKFLNNLWVIGTEKE
jgi:hypothetical protein